MLHIIRGTDLWMTPKLTATMYADRRGQFYNRLGWPVEIDGHGYEHDEYDVENPLYVIISAPDGTHAGSLRLLPTTGNTTLGDHFSETLGRRKIEDPLVWECTRFCLPPKQKPQIALSLLASTARLMRLAGLESLVAIFDARMLRLYKRVGIEPEIIGSQTYAFGVAKAGLWTFDTTKYRSLLQASEIDTLELELVIANTKLPWCIPANAAQMLGLGCR